MVRYIRTYEVCVYFLMRLGLNRLRFSQRNVHSFCAVLEKQADHVQTVADDEPRKSISALILRRD